MYLPPLRYIDFDRSPRAKCLKNDWHKRILEEIDRYRGMPRFLDPLQATSEAVQDSVLWHGFPRALDAWFNIENEPSKIEDAHKAAEVLYRQVPVVVVDGGSVNRVVRVPYDPARNFYLAPSKSGSVSVDDAFGLAERPQDEYLEWFVNRDQTTGAVTRIDFTSEPPEYWQFLADGDPDLTAEIYGEFLKTNVQKEDLIFPGRVHCPRFLVRPGNPPQYIDHVPLTGDIVRNPDDFEEGRYNPSNVWNTEKGAVHLIQRNNTLFAEINLAAEATRRFAARPDLNTQVDRFTLTACGAFGGINRNSDPSIGEFVNTLALDDHRVMVSNPIGLFIAEVQLQGFRDPNGNPVAREEILTTVRGKWDDEPDRARVVRFSIHPPAGADYTLDKCTFNGQPLNTGGPIARETLIAVHGIADPGSATNPLPENPVMGCDAALVEHPTLRPKFFAGVNWAQLLQVSVPMDTISDETTRSMQRAVNPGGRL